MGTCKLANLTANTILSSDLMLDRLFLICPAGCPIPNTTLIALKEWGFTDLQTEENTITKASHSIKTTSNSQNSSTSDAKKRILSSKTEDITDLVERNQNGEEIPANPEIRLALENAKSKDSSNEKTHMQIAQDIYTAYARYISSIYTHYATHKEFNIGEINSTVRELVLFIKDNQRFMLRVTSSLEDRNKNFLVNHSMRATVLALTIGLQLKMPQTKLIELGVACILHEIGMIRLSPQLYMNDRPLTLAEKTQILTHPIISYNIMKECNFPLSIQLAVLDHHERENGSGYPRHSVGNNISLYGKIIGVACSFEAITAPRYFKEARTTYEAMIEMLKNENHQYDDTILKALLYSLSLYPIGAYVYLSNGKIAQVVDVTPDDPKNPVVQIIGQKNEDGTPQNIQTNDTTMKIIRVMNKEEAHDVIKSIETVQKN